MRKSWWAVGVPLVVIAAGVAIVQTSRAVPETQDRSLRVMTYNIEWFSEDANPQRIANLKSVLANTRPDIVVLQEIQSFKAMSQLFDGNWIVVIKDDPREDQELAVAVRKPLRVVNWEMVFPGETLEGAFPRSRDALRVVLESNGKQFTVYCTHMKSRGGGRANTDWQRQMQAGMLAAYIKWKNEPNVIVAGDFNDAPNDVTANVLESGDLFAEAGKSSSKLMVNLCDPLVEKDYVTIGLSALYSGRAISPIVEGSRAENDRFRGQNPNYPADFRVTQSFFDQVLMSPSLARTTSGTAEVYSGGDALQGRGGRVQVSDTGVSYTEKGDRASDHLPVFVDFRVP